MKTYVKPRRPPPQGGWQISKAKARSHVHRNNRPQPKRLAPLLASLTLALPEAAFARSRAAWGCRGDSPSSLLRTDPVVTPLPTAPSGFAPDGGGLFPWENGAITDFAFSLPAPTFLLRSPPGICRQPASFQAPSSVFGRRGGDQRPSPSSRLERAAAALPSCLSPPCCSIGTQGPLTEEKILEV